MLLCEIEGEWRVQCALVCRKGARCAASSTRRQQRWRRLSEPSSVHRNKLPSAAICVPPEHNTRRSAGKQTPPNIVLANTRKYSLFGARDGASKFRLLDGRALRRAFVAFTQAFPASNSRTVSSHRVGGAPDLPIFHPLLVRKAGRSTEQVHVTAGADASSLHITWSANGSSHAAHPSTLNFTLAGSNAPWTVATGPPGEVYSTLMNPRYPKSEGGCEGGVNYTNPYCFYTSLAVHTVKLFGLAPSTKYTFRCGADTTNFTVTTLPATSASRIRWRCRRPGRRPTVRN